MATILFCLFDVLGMRFSPRIRDLGDQRLWRLEGVEIPSRIEFRFKGKINTGLIQERWDDLLRVAGSLKLGYVTASLLMSKLQSYRRQNALTRVLQEYGRLVKTVFILRYLESEPNRKTAFIDASAHVPGREVLRREILLRPLQGRRGVGQFPRMLVQTMLPYQTPLYPGGHHQAGSLLPTWIHTNGAITLRIESGYHPQTNELLGVPSGGTARLLINHIATQVVVQRSRCVDLGETISALLRALGLHRAGDRYREVREQLMRLAFARISYIDQRRSPGRSARFAVKQALVADEIRFWETECVQPSAERSGFGGGLYLTSAFFEEVLTGSVPVDPRVLTYFRKSPLTMDLYTWLTYKCAYMERRGRSGIHVSWQQLHEQFPANYGSVKRFAQRAREALEEIQWIEVEDLFGWQLRRK